jgi:hypothetical protein
MLELPLHLEVVIKVLENIAQVDEPWDCCVELLDPSLHITGSFARSGSNRELAGT